jgi:hypothetical protein
MSARIYRLVNLLLLIRALSNNYGKNAEDVNRACAAIKNTRRRTPTGHRIAKILTEYQNRLRRASEGSLPSPKKLNLLVITDGEAGMYPFSLPLASANHKDNRR